MKLKKTVVRLLKNLFDEKIKDKGFRSIILTDCDSKETICASRLPKEYYLQNKVIKGFLNIGSFKDEKTTQPRFLDKKVYYKTFSLERFPNNFKLELKIVPFPSISNRREDFLEVFYEIERIIQEYGYLS